MWQTTSHYIRIEITAIVLVKRCLKAEGKLGLEGQVANDESSEVCSIIKAGRRVKLGLNRSQAVNVHKLLTIRYLRTGSINRTVTHYRHNTVLSFFNADYCPRAFLPLCQTGGSYHQST